MPHLTIEITDRISKLATSDWDRLVGDHSPFLEYGFLSSLEKSGCLDPHTGWAPRYILAYQDKRLIGALPFYLKENSTGEFVFDFSWADAAHRAGIPYYPKGLVAVPFTPVTGIRILRDPEYPAPDKLSRTLIEAALDLADNEELSSVHFNFLHPSELPLFEDLGLPLRYGIQYHWQNNASPASQEPSPYQDFDGFLARFRSKTRANIRRERRKLAAAGVTTRIVAGPELTDQEMRLVFAYYLDTIQKFFYGQQYLNEEFFLRLRHTLADRLQVVFAEVEGKPFGAAFNLVKGDRLYGRYWGAQQEIPFAHFETCFYRPIEWCIEQGIKIFEPGAGGEHKFERGFTPTLTYSAHYLRHPGLRRAVTAYLIEERAHIKEHLKYLHQQSPFKSP